LANCGFFDLGFFELGFFDLDLLGFGFFDLGFFDLGFFDLGFFDLGLLRFGFIGFGFFGLGFVGLFGFDLPTIGFDLPAIAIGGSVELWRSFMQWQHPTVPQRPFKEVAPRSNLLESLLILRGAARLTQPPRP